MTKQYSITRLLVTKKNLEKRLSEGFSNVVFVDAVRKSRSDKDVINTTAKSSFDKIKALQEQYQKVCAAINKSNSATLVTIAGTEMTVAEAILRKQALPRERSFVNTLRAQLAQTTRIMERNQAEIDAQVESRVEAALGRDSKQNLEKQREFIESIRATVEDEYKLELVGISDAEKTIQKLVEDLDAFESEVDIVLNESNAATVLEVDLSV
jgi:predicted  nucleic acid-binding Zn-ribbon protein